MSRETVSRKKLLQEPDEFLTLSQQVWLWVHENRRKTALAGGAVAATVLLGVGIKAYVEHARGQRSTAVAAAVARYTQAPGGAVPADLRQELAALADRYSGSPEGAVARFFEAGALAGAGETDQARRVYTTIAGLGPELGDLALLARQALAYLDLASGSADGALQSFQELLKAQGGAVARSQIMLEIAAIHEKKGRTDDARRVYQDLLASHPDGPWAATAKERLRVLGGSGTPPS